jgi:hypothetical protein
MKSNYLADSRNSLAPGTEFLWALVAWFIFVVALFFRHPIMFEADDYAYRAAIVALSHGHITLNTTQYLALNAQLKGSGSFGILQWSHLPNGTWISEKNPGYAFIALPFYLMGSLQLLPVFASLIATVGLFLGARKWLGPRGGLLSVILFLFNGAALAFGLRFTMPTFTEACFIAGASGFILWSLLEQRFVFERSVVSSIALALLGLATFSRYTNVGVLVIATICLMWNRKKAYLPLWCLIVWVLIVNISIEGILAFNAHFYGGLFSTGYYNTPIGFSLSSISQNIRHAPLFNLISFPVVLLALVGTVSCFHSRSNLWHKSGMRVFGLSTGEGFLILSVIYIWVLYLCYNETAMSMSWPATYHEIRFFIPSLGAIALLGAKALQRWKVKWQVVAVLLLVVHAFWAFAWLPSHPAHTKVLPTTSLAWSPPSTTRST